MPSLTGINGYLEYRLSFTCYVKNEVFMSNKGKLFSLPESPDIELINDLQEAKNIRNNIMFPMSIPVLLLSGFSMGLILRHWIWGVLFAFIGELIYAAFCRWYLKFMVENCYTMYLERQQKEKEFFEDMSIKEESFN